MKINSLKFFLYIFFIAFFSIKNAYAGFEKAEEAAAQIIQRVWDVSIDNEGFFTETVISHVKILKQRGRNRGTFVKKYTKDSQIIENILASTWSKNGVQIPVPQENIEIKEVAGQSNGFDDLIQLKISYTGIEVGAERHLSYVRKSLRQIIPGYYASHYVWGDDENLWPSGAGLLTVRSKRPFFHTICDRDGHLKVTQGSDEQGWYLRAELDKEIYRKLYNEDSDNRIPDTAFPSLTISTFETIEAIGNRIAPDYEAVLKEPLPLFMQDIFEKIIQEPSLEGQAIKAIEEICRKVRYFGEWRTLAGKMICPSLEDINTKRYTDCKGFATVLVKLLRTLGHEAYVAFVYRGRLPLDSMEILPHLGEFNHAIAVVKRGDHLIWMDPTNNVAMVHGPFSDIAGRKALVLDPSETHLEDIPEVNVEHARRELKKTILFKGSSQIGSGDIVYTGQEAILPKEYQLISQAKAKCLILKAAAQGVMEEKQGDLKWDMDEKSLEIKDIHASFSYQIPNCFGQSNLGDVYTIPVCPLILEYFNVQTDQEGYSYIWTPCTRTFSIKLVGVKAMHPEKLNCDLEGFGLSLKRKIFQEEDGLALHETAVFRNRYVTPEEARSEAYVIFLNKLKSYSKGSLVLEDAI